MWEWRVAPLPQKLSKGLEHHLTIAMQGIFQSSQLRIELSASDTQIRDSLLRPEQFRTWMAPQQFEAGLPDELSTGLSFRSWLGPVTIQHSVENVNPNTLRFILSGGIDGFHEWHWGEGWLQSRLEGVSILPLNLGQTLVLLRLRQSFNHP